MNKKIIISDYDQTNMKEYFELTKKDKREKMQNRKRNIICYKKIRKVFKI